VALGPELFNNHLFSISEAGSERDGAFPKSKGHIS